MSAAVIRDRVATASLLHYASCSRENGYFNDVTIVVGNEAISANRMVLSCFSPYFNDMFKSPLVSSEKFVEIRAVESTTMNALIDFIYYGSIAINSQNVVGLLSGANYFKLDEVKQFCYEFISQNLSEVSQTVEFKSCSKDDVKYCFFNLDHSKTEETEIYHAIVTWSYHNQENETEFFELFKTLKLNALTPQFLEEVVLEEKLVLGSRDCRKLALATFRILVKNDKFKEESSHIICLGGTQTRQKVSVVLNLGHETPQYPNFDSFEGVARHKSLKMDNYVYCIGGELGKRAKTPRVTNKVKRIDLLKKNMKWEFVASMNTQRHAMGASQFGSALFVAGGTDKKGHQLNSCEVYSPVTNEWIFAPSLNVQRFANSLVLCNGSLYALGGCGSNGAYLSSVERLNDLKSMWQDIHSMLEARKWFAAVNYNEAIYAIGGKSALGKKLKTVEMYDCDTNQWKYVANMNIARSSHAACVLQEKIYVVGGLDDDSSAIRHIDCYDPRENRWVIVGRVHDDLDKHALVAVSG